MTTRHTKETKKERINRARMGDYVFMPTGTYAMFGAWIGMGVGISGASALAAIITDNVWFLFGIALGIPAILYGWNGNKMLRWRLGDYVDDILDAVSDSVKETTINDDKETAVNGERNIPLRRGGKRSDHISITDDNPLSSEAWRAVAIALLVSEAKLSRRGICGITGQSSWQWGKVSQGQYTQFIAYMFKNKYAKEGQYGTELLAGGWDVLQRYVPSHMSLELAKPTPPPAE